MIEAICIDSSNKPDEIPLSKWIQKDFKYHITHIYFHPGQGIQGVELHEVKLGPECYPFESYRLSRFVIKMQDLPLLIQMMKDCTDLDYVNIEKLIKESGVIETTQ